MSLTTVLSVVLLSAIGLGAGVAIYIFSRVLPKEDASLKKAEEIRSYLPGADCGACGYPGCFAYAQAVAKDKNTAERTPCPTLSQDEDATAALGQHLGLSLSGGGVGDKAVVHCAGASPALATYAGINSCAAAAQLASGYKECPYACLGFGDCVDVCPVDAITLTSSNGVAQVSWSVCIGCGQCVEACPQQIIELIPGNMPQYLGCSYLSKKDVPGRPRCDTGCIHCQVCVKLSSNGEVEWDEVRDLPTFPQADAKQADMAVKKCPKNIILKTSAFKEAEESES